MPCVSPFLKASEAPIFPSLSEELLGLFAEGQACLCSESSGYLRLL